MGLSTFTILGHSHKLQLLNVPQLKQIEGNKFDEAIKPAFQAKERLARHAHENKLSVRAFKKYIDQKYPSERIDLTALPSQDELRSLGAKKLNGLKKAAEKKIAASKKLIADYTEVLNSLEAVLAQIEDTSPASNANGNPGVSTALKNDQFFVYGKVGLMFSVCIRQRL